MRFVIIIFLLFMACQKETLNTSYDNHYCVYGTNKTTKKVEFIACIHRDIYLAGTNQVTANNIAESMNIPYVNVSIMANYSNRTYTRTSDCNCKP
jgi:hypothetical protein